LAEPVISNRSFKPAAFGGRWLPTLVFCRDFLTLAGKNQFVFFREGVPVQWLILVSQVVRQGDKLARTCAINASGWRDEVLRRISWLTLG
jgi:hypothetical protein